ncbi:hypothetical protein F4802DRAFT_611660 [Xylaria palmicola]|nr:hypothetical protein F4802DRAFT_611660 [Xylaria palmicola]
MSMKSRSAPKGTQYVPEEQDRKQEKIAPLDPSREPTSQLSQRVSSWLNEVHLAPTQEVQTIGRYDSSPDSEHNCTTDTASSSSSLISSDAASMVRSRAARKRPYEDILDKLRTRRALPDILTGDGKTETFKSTFSINDPIKIPYKDTKTLQTAVTSFLLKAQNAGREEDSCAAVEDLSNQINEWKATVHLATITNLDFQKDLTRCKHSNEAVFQRTMMISIIDRWRLNDMFDFNCEGDWSLQGTYPLPSTLGLEDEVSGPTPDLAIFFNTESLLGSEGFSAPIPPSLKSCIFPDDYVRRCFPFVFIEARAAFHNIKSALYANMHSASQALFNIYTWMRRAGQTDAFFRDVRLFSVAINAEQVIVRTHRAKPLDSADGLVFLCDELCDLYGYDRDTVCRLIRNILMEYGAKELCKILRSTVEEVSQQYAEGTFQNDEPSKRQSDASLGAPSKKRRTS